MGITLAGSWSVVRGEHIQAFTLFIVLELDGTETHEDMFEENEQTEARDARGPHASELKQSIFSSHYQGRCAHRAGSKMPGPQIVRKKPVSRRQEESRLQTVQKKKKNIAVRPWVRPPVLLPVL